MCQRTERAFLIFLRTKPAYLHNHKGLLGQVGQKFIPQASALRYPLQINAIFYRIYRNFSFHTLLHKDSGRFRHADNGIIRLIHETVEPSCQAVLATHVKRAVLRSNEQPAKIGNPFGHSSPILCGEQMYMYHIVSIHQPAQAPGMERTVIRHCM